MENDFFKHIAAQLRKPEGPMGKQVGEKMNEGNALLNRWTIELLNISAEDNILEIGMGNGAFASDICKANISVRYTGIDHSEMMMEEATKINEQLINNNQAHFVLASADVLPFMTHSFDKVFTVNTIYFWEDAGKVFNEIKRVMKPDGRLVIGIRPKAVMKENPFTQHGFMLYSKEELVELLSRYGFEIDELVEREEPDQQLNGRAVKMASLIVRALISRNEIQKEQ